MIELLLLLIGGRVVRGRWRTLAVIGIIWMMLGGLLFIDAMSAEIFVSPYLFTIPLLIDAAISAVAALSGAGAYRRIRFAKVAVLVAISALIVLRPGGSDMAVGLLVGTLLVVDSIWRVASAWVVRFVKWRRSLVFAVFELALGIWSFLPWPTHWQGEVGIDVGTLMAVSGASLVGLAVKLRFLPPNMKLARVLSEGWPSEERVEAMADATRRRSAGALRVHVWTPTGDLAPLSRGVARYVAALDENGVISTGHAALEAGPDIYVSHYPAVEIDRDQSNFAHALKATEENNVPGKFQPDYAFESAEWRPSSFQVDLRGVDVEGLRSFWSEYRRDETYNLTNRNCSSAVAKALDAAIEGVFGDRSLWFLLRLLTLPELWAAGVMRRRAVAMAWTPGMVLDYARALSVILSLPGASENAVSQKAA